MHLVEVGVQRDVGLAPQVGDVDRVTTARLEHPVNLLCHSPDQAQVFFQAQVVVIFFAVIIRRRGKCQAYAVVWQGYVFG